MVGSDEKPALELRHAYVKYGGIIATRKDIRGASISELNMLMPIECCVSEERFTGNEFTDLHIEMIASFEAVETAEVILIECWRMLPGE